MVDSWESYATPPGDIVLAAATLAQEVPGDVLSLPLNEDAGRKAAMVSAIGPVMDSMGDSSVVSYTDRGLVTGDQWERDHPRRLQLPLALRDGRIRIRSRS